MANSKPEIGKTYHVSHQRKGDFVMRVTGVHGEWIDGVVAEGMADAILRDNRKFEGDPITVRESFCHFTEIAK